jgi:Helix-turn-helix domain of transposase family ISL3
MASKPPIRGKRTRLYESAVAALLTETTVKNAAAKCSISYSTLQRWMLEPEFLKLYNDAKNELLQSVKNQLRQLGTKAVATLNDAIDDRTVATNDKLSASKFVIDRILEFEVTDSLNVRLEALENSNEAD